MPKYERPLLDLDGSVNPGDEPYVDRGTIFVEDDLDIPGRAPMSAIYVPGAFQPTSFVNVLLYLHGHGNSSSIKDYFHRYRLREIVEDSGKNLVFIAPTLGTRSEAGLLVRPGVIQTYLNDMMGFLHDYGPYKTEDPEPRVRTVVMAAHSGGGAAMADIADNIARSTNNNPECWGFDCQYDTGAPLGAPAPLTVKDPSHAVAPDQAAWENYLLGAVEGSWVTWCQGGRKFKAFYGGGGTLTRTANLQLYAMQQGAYGVTVVPSFFDNYPIAAISPIPHAVSAHDFVPKTVLGKCLRETAAL